MGSRRKINDEKIVPIFTASNTGLLKIGMYARFLVHQLCAGLLNKVQNPDPNLEKSITGLGLHGGYYYHLEPRVIKESNKNHLNTGVRSLHLYHKLQGPNIKNYQDLKPSS